MRVARIVLAGMLLSSTSGCIALLGATAGAAAAVGAYSYAENGVSREYETSLERSVKATQSAVRDMGFNVQEFSQGTSDAKVTAKTTDGKGVDIALERLEAKRTRISVRVGSFDNDENRSAAQRIHEKIRDETA